MDENSSKNKPIIKENKITALNSTNNLIEDIAECLKRDNFVNDITESLDREIYENLHDDPFYTIATEIRASFNWVFSHHAPIDQNIERQNIEWDTAKKECKKKYQPMSLDDALEDLTLQQARLFWYFKGCPENQPKKKELDDYYNGKRWLAYLITDSLLQNCKIKNCAKVLLQKEYVDYLKILSVEEFIRSKAYLIWDHRCKEQFCYGWGTTVQDFKKASNFLDGLLENCYDHKCDSKENIIFLDKVPDYLPETVKEIITGKKGAINRIWDESNPFFQEVESFVDDYYKHYGKLISMNKIKDYSIFHKIIGSLDDKLSVVNMFEYISKCVLKCFLLIETNDILSRK